MNGGLIESLKKLYLGKDVIKRHLILLVVAALTMLPCSFIKEDLSGYSNYEMLKALAEVGLWAVLLYLVGNFFLSLYSIHFTHNSLKFFLWADHQDDSEKINSLDIAPKFDKNIMNYAGTALLYYICLFLIFMAILIPTIVIAVCIPIAGWALLILVLLVISVSAPYMLVGFSKTYDIKNNISPVLLIKYFPQVFLPTLVLGFKIFLTLIIAIIIGFSIGFLVGFTFALISFSKQFGVFLASTISFYIFYIVILMSQYAMAYIYYDRIEINKEI